MPSRTLPNLGLEAFFDLGENGWDDEVNLNFLRLSALVQGGVVDIVSATPGSPTDGDVYLFAADHPTNANDIAIRDDGAWVYVTPLEGWRVYDRTGNNLMLFDGGAWVVFSGGGDGGTVVVEDSGTEIISAASILNFTGAGVAVTDEGDGRVGIDIAGGGGGGGGGAMELITQWSHTTDVPNVTFTDLGGYTELLLIVRNVTLSVAGIRAAALSVDNGATFFTAAAAYQEIPGGGVESGALPQLHTTSSNAARSGVARLTGNVAGSPKLYEFRANRSIFVGSNNIVNAIRVYDGNASANLTGGQIYLYGRP